MKLQSAGNGHFQLRSLFLIIATSVITVLFTFLGLSAFNLNVSQPNVPIQGLQSAGGNPPCDCTREETVGLKTAGFQTNYDDNVISDDIDEVREIATHSPDDKCVKKLPQAIIAGIQKCGTTALLKFLSAHPQIVACLDPVETMYFSAHYNKPLSWYKNLMPCSYSNQITMEKSPPYFYRGFCADRIYKMEPKTKIIFIVKDPVVRTESMYAMIKRQLHGQTFSQAVTSGNLTKINTKTSLIDFSNYPKYIGAWLNKFDRRQILFVDGHNMEVNPSEELNIVERFLGVGTYFTPEKFMFNETKGKYCLFTDEVGIRCLAAKKGRQHPEYGSDVRKLLEDYFKPLNEKFFSMIKRRFDWGY